VGTALTKLARGERGKILLDGVCTILLQQKKKITIEQAGEVGGQKGSGWDDKDYIVRWSTEEHQDPEDWDQLNGVAPFIILGHELIHALHTLTNSTNYGYDSKTNIAIEEARTVGLGPWKDDALTENGLRAEWKVRPRTTFQGVGPDRLLKGTKYHGM
jgi:hypothetical protein